MYQYWTLIFPKKETLARSSNLVTIRDAGLYIFFVSFCTLKTGIEPKFVHVFLVMWGVYEKTYFSQ